MARAMKSFLAATGVLCASLGVSTQPSRVEANAVVAADGSGDYMTIQDAIDAVPQSTSGSNRWVILVKPGIYHERVYVQREKRFVSLVGADPSTVVISYGLYASMNGPDGKPIGTFRTPTVQIDADDFSAENVTFDNSAGRVGQALAVRVDGDRAVFRNCRFIGWQDTILLNRGRHYIEDSLIAGDVDFIFGGATAWFERCQIFCRRDGYVTAASTPTEAPYGFVFANSSITGAPGVRTYLGRPWRDYAQVTFLTTMMTDVVRPIGWHNWDRSAREQTARYREYASSGEGGSATGRATWMRQLSSDEARSITVTSVLSAADGWNPQRVPTHRSGGRAVDTLPE